MSYLSDKGKELGQARIDEVQKERTAAERYRSAKAFFFKNDLPNIMRDYFKATIEAHTIPKMITTINNKHVSAYYIGRLSYEDSYDSSIYHSSNVCYVNNELEFYCGANDQNNRDKFCQFSEFKKQFVVDGPYHSSSTDFEIFFEAILYEIYHEFYYTKNSDKVFIHTKEELLKLDTVEEMIISLNTKFNEYLSRYL